MDVLIFIVGAALVVASTALVFKVAPRVPDAVSRRLGIAFVIVVSAAVISLNWLIDSFLTRPTAADMTIINAVKALLLPSLLLIFSLAYLALAMQKALDPPDKG